MKYNSKEMRFENSNSDEEKEFEGKVSRSEVLDLRLKDEESNRGMRNRKRILTR